MLKRPRVAATINNLLGYPPQWWQENFAPSGSALATAGISTSATTVTSSITRRGLGDEG